MTCFNQGICQASLLNYTCQCIDESILWNNSNVHIVVCQTVWKSFAYIVIITMLIVAMFIIILDVLKYCFHINPAGNKSEQIQQKKWKKEIMKPSMAIRFIYINALLIELSDEMISSIEETNA